MAETTHSDRPGSAASYARSLLPFVFTVGLLSGCAAPQPAAEMAPVEAPPPVEVPEDRYVRDSERIAADPVAFLRKVAERTSQLEEYRLTFYRQERLGLPPQLGPMEEIEAAFRQEPFSVKFEWADEEMPYYEAVYVAGNHNGKLIVRERNGALPLLPPTVRALDPMFSVKIGRSKNPITDFGLERMMKRTLLPFEDPQIAEVMTIEYVGLVDLEPTHRPAHRIRIERPKTPGLAYTRQDLYFDAETLLPAGTDLYLPGDILDARYRYANINPDVNLNESDFRLSKDHPKT